MNAVDAGRHGFTIPVMGIAFTIDSPLRVARYGISSTVSLVDDLFCEQMRKLYCEQYDVEYVAIAKSATDGRAKRITAYLNLLDQLVNQQISDMRALPFEAGNELCRYFELLPQGALRSRYEEMLACSDEAQKSALQAELRKEVVPGAINTNIMTKLDRDLDLHGKPRELGQSDALAAARGFAKSTVDGTLVLSAGMNPRLYTYLATLSEFHPDEQGYAKKRIALKVSDYRSAEVQGKVFAKKGIWVSEYRIESGLNCGGHAFATLGSLMGPILAVFKAKRADLAAKLLVIYNKALTKASRPFVAVAPSFNITVQGGIGTADEQALLHDYFEVDSTGWGTPFLLVPEATNLDEKTRQGIASCKDEDIQISDSSPLGVPFWNFMQSGSELARRERIEGGRSGSPCPKGFIALPRDFQDIPLCAASRKYQERQLKVLEDTERSASELSKCQEAIRVKSCICHDLSGAATLEAGIDKKATPAICPGPNIVNFDKIVNLDEMLGHIYGRASIISRQGRPHMFLRELELYVEDFYKQLAAGAPKMEKYETNLRAGIEFYRDFARNALGTEASAFITALDAQLAALPPLPTVDDEEDEGEDGGQSEGSKNEMTGAVFTAGQPFQSSLGC